MLEAIMKKLIMAVVIIILLITLLFSIVKINDKKDIIHGEAKEISVFFSQHPYVEAIIKELDEFTNMTGINVTYTIIPEETYYQVLSERFNENFDEPDIFMIGPYFLWEFKDDDILENLNQYIYTSEVEYDLDDFYENVLDIYRFNDEDEESILGLPLGFEVTTLAYNKRIFEELNLELPKTYQELLEISQTISNENKEYYALACRGNDDWATINTGYISMYANYILTDYDQVNTELYDKINSKESIEMNKLWFEIIKSGASKEWDYFTWSKASADFGAGRAAMLLDMDNVAYYQNIKGESKESGNIGWTSIPRIDSEGDFISNLWSWGLSMNSEGDEKEAAWSFIKYFTSKDFLLKASTEYKLMIPPRKSVFNSSEFQKVISNSDGYTETLEKTIPNARVILNEENNILDILENWTKTVRLIYFEGNAIDEKLDDLKEQIEQITKE